MTILTNYKEVIRAVRFLILGEIEIAAKMKHLNMLTKSLSCNEIWTKQMPPHSANNEQQQIGGGSGSSGAAAAIDLAASKRHKSSDKLAKPKTENHKTVIYFGDSISSKKQHSQLQQQMKAQQIASGGGGGGGARDDVGLNHEPSDLKHAQRLCDEMVFKRQQQSDIRNPIRKPNEVHSKCTTDEMVTIVNDVKVIGAAGQNVVKHLKSVIEEKCQLKSDKPNGATVAEMIAPKNFDCRDKNAIELAAIDRNANDMNATKVEIRSRQLPSFVESVVNGVINIRIDDSYDAATKLLRALECADTDDTDSFDAMDDGNDLFLDVGGEVNNMYLDWSFVQDWRSRYIFYMYFILHVIVIDHYLPILRFANVSIWFRLNFNENSAIN